MDTKSTSIVDVQPQSRAGRCLRLFGLWLLDCCAATSTAWFVPYEPAFWRDWRIDLRMRYLDLELRGLVAETRSGGMPPVAE